MGGSGLTQQVNGNFIINGPVGATPSFLLISGTNLELGGNFQLIDPTSFAADDNTTVIFRKTVTTNTQIRIDNATTTIATFYNVTFDNGNDATTNIVTFGGGPTPPSILEVRNNLTITSGRLNSGTGGGIRLLGNLTSSGSVVGQSNASLEFAGPNDQVVTFTGADNAIWNGPVTVNKEGGSVTLGAPWVLNGNGQNMTFTSGIVNTTTTNYLQFGPNATASGHSTASYVNGPVRKQVNINPDVVDGNAAFTFPVGDGQFYGPIHMSGSNASFTAPLVKKPTSATPPPNTYIFQATYVHQDPTTTWPNTVPPLSSGIPVTVSQTEYWLFDFQGTLAQYNPSYAPNLWLSYEDARSGGLQEPSSVGAVAWLTSRWENLGGGGTVTDNGSTYFPAGAVAFSAADNNPVFTIGTTNPALNPLPVTWIDFTGRSANGTTLLNWITSVEKDNAFFTVERSADNSGFETIGKVAGKGNSSNTNYYSYTDNAPLSGDSYYRIKQTDLDGKYSYSKTIRVSNNGTAAAGLRLYPNPLTSGQQLTVENSSLRSKKVTVTILNAVGATVRQEQMTFGSDSRLKLNISNLQKGAYFLRVQDNSNRTVQPFIVQ